MTRSVLIALLVVAFPGAVLAENGVNGYVRTYAGVWTTEDPGLSILQNRVELKLSESGPVAAFMANPFLIQHDDGLPELGLRQAYVDLYLGSFDLRVGRQQVIWGKADGVFITDVVSPKDLREFLLPDFEEIRMGVTGVRADWYLGNHTLELVWVPVFQPTRMPEPGSPWAPAALMPEGAILDESRREVPLDLDNGEVFGRYSLLSSWGDLEVVGAWMWDDEPSLHRKVAPAPETGGMTVTVMPEHHRLPMGGASYSTAAGPFVLKAEGAYYHGKRFRTSSPGATDGLVEKGYLHGMAGASVKVLDVNVAVQLIERVILGHEAGMLDEQLDHMMTAQLGMDFLRETLHVSLFSYMGMDPWNALLRPSVSYDITDGVQAMVGGNVFLGTEGMFGQFDANDMIYARLKYSF